MTLPLPVEEIQDFPRKILTLDGSSWQGSRKFVGSERNRRVAPSENI